MFVPDNAAEDALYDMLVTSYLTDLAALRHEARMQPALAAAATHFPADHVGLSALKYVGLCLLALREHGGIAPAVPALAEMVCQRAPGRVEQARKVAGLFA